MYVCMYVYIYTFCICMYILHIFNNYLLECNTLAFFKMY